ncbi:MAG: class I SAM-dependent methyltransferase [Erythrobacter sp.]
MVVHKTELNTASRRRKKAEKIEALLGRSVKGADLLDLGAGSGHLSDYFIERGANVSAADTDGYRYVSAAPFFEIAGEDLPFADASFDIVIFNHVLEHVGDRPAQRKALSEIKRVLRPGGTLYLGVPNKWELVETHYRLPLLGALPKKLSDRLVQIFRKQPEYDCYPLSYGELTQLVNEQFASFADRTGDAYDWVVKHELSGAKQQVFRMIPLLKPIAPTFILVAQA